MWYYAGAFCWDFGGAWSGDLGDGGVSASAGGCVVDFGVGWYCVVFAGGVLLGL